ncbi:c-type cytochrome, partial [Mucilaginibacter sp.]|uniref:c-type cytochrome n=1 Tax=Mucilaginibacter sp. TaxID=1882438 RepID=UPI0035BC8DAA
MRNISLIFKQLTRSILLVAGLAVCGLNAHAQADAAKGEAIFKAKCTACHKIDVRMTGPALGPQLTQETDDAYLTKWIQNNQALIAAKNPKALKIYNEFNQANMTVFAELSDADVGNIITYVREDYKKLQADKAKGPAGGGAGAAAETGTPSNLVIFGLIGVIVIAFIVILVLNKVIATLERLLMRSKGLVIEEEEEGEEKVAVDRLAGVKKALKNKKLVFFIVLCGFIALGSFSWVTMWNTNVHQGYQPVQPIKYSHELHAGAMKIECQYCHTGAYKSKNAS